MTITGGCLCGAVRYSIEAEPLVARTCWCRACQFIGGGSATVNVTFLSEAVSIGGTLSEVVNTADSGNVMHWRFCPACGTHVCLQGEMRPHLFTVRAGTLDDPEIGKPSITI